MMGNHSAAPNAPQLKQKKIIVLCIAEINTPFTYFMFGDPGDQEADTEEDRGLHYDHKFSFVTRLPSLRTLQPTSPFRWTDI